MAEIITKTASKLLCQFARNRFLLKLYTLLLYTHNIEQANEGRFLILLEKIIYLAIELSLDSLKIIIMLIS